MTGFESKRQASKDLLEPQSAARTIADEQSYDTGLWFVATTVSEAHLQAALRRLTAAVEGAAPVARTPLTNGEIYTAYIAATNQTLRPQDERLAFGFARAIEAAHGIGATP
jgi:hypothetical protein